jgi:hypothetical protein
LERHELLSDGLSTDLKPFQVIAIAKAAYAGCQAAVTGMMDAAVLPISRRDSNA